MKVLYIGHIREGTGWSRAAISGIRSLLSIGVEVVYRDIKLAPYGVDLPEDIVECEMKDLNNIDLCIQHVLPYFYVKTSKVKNVGYLEYEALSFNSGWKEYISMMDEIWVPNNTLLKTIMDGSINKKVKCVPHATDIEQYSISTPNISIPDLDYTYKFYTLSDLNDRKNITSLIRAFHLSFDRDMPVSLIIKAKNNMVSENDLAKYIENICVSEKSLLRLYKDVDFYKKEFIITGDMPSNQILSLHKYGDCFVNSSSGEAWSYPTFDAMALGKTVISSRMGTDEYLSEYNNTFFVNGRKSVCLNRDSAFADLYTARDVWNFIEAEELANRMVECFENRNRAIINNGMEIANKFSYASVGNIIKKVL